MEGPISDIDITEFKEVYSPTTILGIYSNAIRTSADNKVILAKGIFQLSQIQKEYSGYYYDTLKSPNDNKSIRTKIPSLLRSKLDNNSIYIFKGYIEKKINYSAIELIFVVDDVLQKEINNVSETDLQRFEMLQKKVGTGFRDLEGMIKEHIYNEQKLRIANLYGTTAIVNSDFDLGIAEARKRYDLSEFRCNFSSKPDLISAIQKLKVQNFDVIAIVRGGGDKASLEIFNDPELGETIIGIKPIVVTALGHTVDETLFDKLADKKFALPHDYGNSLKVWVDQAVEEQAKSKSVFMDQVKKDLTKTFQDQITTLQNQLGIKNKEFEAAQLKFKEMVEQNQKDKAETILAKEKSFEAGIKSLQEQIKTKDESLKLVQANNETTIKQQVASATAEVRTKFDIMNAERERMAKEVNELSGVKTKMIIYVIIAVVVGVVLGRYI